MRLGVALAVAAAFLTPSLAVDRRTGRPAHLRARAAAPHTPWCGGDAESATDRPDAIPAFEIHVVYAVPANGADRFAERVPEIATDAASVDIWWRDQNPAPCLRGAGPSTPSAS